MTITDAELIAKAKLGNEQAFRQIVERHQQRVRTTIWGMLGNSTEADDVAQEVFIRFYRSINDFRADAKLSTYLTRIAINLSLNELKRKKRRNSRVVSLFWKAEEEEKVLQIADKSADLSSFDARESIQHALQQLSDEYRTVVVLRLVEGFTVQETSKMLGIPMGTIASRLSRAQLKLKEILKDYE